MFRVLITAVATLAICVSLSANGADEKAKCIGDVVFLMDNTGSMGSMISSTRRQAKKILKAIAGEDAAYPHKGLDVSIIPDRSECSSSGIGWEWLVRIGNGGSAKTAQYDHNGDGKVTTAGDEVKDSSGETVGYAARKVTGKGLLATPSVIGNRRFTPTRAVAETKDMLTTVLVNYPKSSGRISWHELKRN